MPAQIDEPTPGSPVDPSCLFVRGRVWQGVEQSELTAVEAWCGDALPGETTTLYTRATCRTRSHCPPMRARASTSPPTRRRAAGPCHPH